MYFDVDERDTCGIGSIFSGNDQQKVNTQKKVHILCVHPKSDLSRFTNTFLSETHCTFHTKQVFSQPTLSPLKLGSFFHESDSHPRCKSWKICTLTIL